MATRELTQVELSVDTSDLLKRAGRDVDSTAKMNKENPRNRDGFRIRREC